MKISRNWLQTYFEEALPNAEVLSNALTFHAFEIDGVEKVGEDDVLDVKVTPNRGHDCLCHVGIAKELSAILQIPIKNDPLSQTPPARALRAARSSLTLASGSLTDAVSERSLMGDETVSVSIKTPLCQRYIAGHLRGVKVGPSPEWLQERLASMGQRSINNIVDATNYVMFDLGQPLHAFAAEKLAAEGGSYAIAVRAAHEGECLLALDDKSYTLSPEMMAIVDGNTDAAIGIAGVKGGKPAGIADSTNEIIIESANFDGVSVRKTAQKLKLRTDASARYEQELSPELAPHAMRAVVDLILALSPSAEVVGFVDAYPEPQTQTYVSVTTEKVNQVLGTALTGADIADAFVRLGFSYKEEQGVFEVQPPFPRLDIAIPEDLIEEVGRIIGYDKVPATPLPPFPKKPEINKNFYAAEKAREELANKGFSEVFTSVFADKGERVVLNKVDGVRPYLRSNLANGLSEAYEKNIFNKDLLGIKLLKLFEIGTVWVDGGERQHIAWVEETPLKGGKSAHGPVTEKILEPIEAAQYENLPLSETERYQPFSKYPYIVRDVAFWIPKSVDLVKFPGYFVDTIDPALAGSNLSTQIGFLDQFQKDGRTSLAYRLVFQSFSRTLVDGEIQVIMEKIYKCLQEKGFEIR